MNLWVLLIYFFSFVPPDVVSITTYCVINIIQQVLRKSILNLRYLSLNMIIYRIENDLT